MEQTFFKVSMLLQIKY